MTRDTQLLLSGIKGRMGRSGAITDPATAEMLKRLGVSLGRIIRGGGAEFLPSPGVEG